MAFNIFMVTIYRNIARPSGSHVDSCHLARNNSNVLNWSCLFEEQHRAFATYEREIVSVE
jgi:hypothetical protein